MIRTVERRKVLWSPHHESRFLVGGNDLRLYEIKHNRESHVNVDQFQVLKPNECVPDEPETLVPLGYCEVPSLRSFDWCLDPTRPSLLAAGLSTGKILLADLEKESDRIEKEFIPSQQPRSCNVVAWNPQQKHLLATGLDKARIDFSCFIWDVQVMGESLLAEKKVPSHTRHSIFSMSPMNAPEKVETPHQKFASSETITSLAWLPNNAHSLAIGTGKKWLRIYDLRDVNRPVSSVAAHLTKSVYGVCFDPFNENCVATFSEEHYIKLWDIRNLNADPMVVLPTNNKILQIEWCPTKGPGILTSLCKDDTSIKIWNVNGDTLRDPKKTIKAVTHHKPYDSIDVVEKTLTFSWHPTIGKVLAVSQDSLEINPVHESMPITFSVKSRLAFGHRKNIFEGKVLSDDNVVLKDDADLSMILYNRAVRGYSGDLAVNKTLVQEFQDKDLEFVWNWLYEMKYIYSKGKSGDIKGLNTIVRQKFDIKIDLKCTFPMKTHFPVHIHDSPGRYYCLRLCGWDFKTDEDVRTYARTLHSQNQTERAVALAVFYHDVKLALSLLNDYALDTSHSSDALQHISMALSGFMDMKDSSHWKKACLMLKKRITDPYLYALICFLVPSKNSHWDVLMESNMSLSDKLAFACIYLSDKYLLEYYDLTQAKIVSEGKISGLILTGLDSNGVGIDLLQQYLTRTGDIQTVSLLVSHTPPHRSGKSQKAQMWIEIYRSMLDRWSLWMERAKFDVHRGTNFDISPPPQVFSRCNYCTKSLEISRNQPQPCPSIIPGATGVGIMGMTGRIPQDKSKIPACPHCRKPLPRCAICLLPLECIVPNMEPSRKDTNEGRVWGTGISDFDLWFSWCQTCKHGGHSRHMHEWFQQNNVCPVSDCDCMCSIK